MGSPGLLSVQSLHAFFLTCISVVLWLQDWQGRSWNRLNLHNHIHRAHYARHIVANALSQRSLSPPQSSPELHGSSSPSRAKRLSSQGVAAEGSSGGLSKGVSETGARLASDAANSAERPLPELTHPHQLNSAAAESRHTGAEAAVGELRVNEQLLVNGMRRGDPSTHPWLANGHAPTELSRPAGASQLMSQSKALNNIMGNGATPPEECAAPDVGDSRSAARAAADSMRPPAGSSGENGSLATEDQQQEVMAQMNGISTPQPGPASVKAFFNGIRPDAAPWGDLDPALAKSRAALNRYIQQSLQRWLKPKGNLA